MDTRTKFGGIELSDTNWHDYFYYDETSPSCLRWKVDRYRGNHKWPHKFISKGDIAGSIGKKEYCEVKLFNKIYKVHRVIYEMEIGEISLTMKIDHFDKNPRNNFKTNLRIVSNAVNCRNKGMYKKNTSGVTGVSLHHNGHGNFYWNVQWCDLTGKIKSKAFSISKLGNDKAFDMASSYRLNIIEDLNKQGAGYTDTHGGNTNAVNKFQ